jgi:hypothetical protein
MGMKRRSFLKSLLSVPVVAAVVKSTTDAKSKEAIAKVVEEVKETPLTFPDKPIIPKKKLPFRIINDFLKQPSSNIKLEYPPTPKPDWSKVTNKNGEWYMDECIKITLEEHLEAEVRIDSEPMSGGTPYYEFYCSDTVTGERLFILEVDFSHMQISDEDLREQLQLMWESFMYYNATMYEDHKEFEEK